MQDLRSPIFQAGLALKLALLVLLTPQVQTDWFVPFISSLITHPSLTPWATFLAQGGDPNAFPYGPVMIMAVLPLSVVGWILDQLTSGSAFIAFGFRLSLLAADYVAFRALAELFPDRRRGVEIFYWLSPIVIFVTYIHGQLDIVPVSLLVVSLLLTRRGNLRAAGIALGLAIAAKFSMLIAAPFLVLYILKNRALRAELVPFLACLAAPVVLLQAPFLADPGFWTVVLRNREIERLYQLRLALQGNVDLYLTPLLLIAAMYFAWRLRRINFQLLVGLISISFLILIFTGSAPPGWYVWLVPFLTIQQIEYRSGAVVLSSALAAAFIAFYALSSTGAVVNFTDGSITTKPAWLEQLPSPHVMSLLFTALSALGLVTAVQIARVGIRENEYYRLTRRPFAIGIAGDSGSGKDTLANALIGLFGAHSTTHISGDDYHIWDRSGLMWKAVTHLNPRANRLFQFTTDAVSLIRRRSIVSRHYDHSTGRYSKLREVHSNDIIIVSGLHSLFMKPLRDRLEVSFFLDMNESLRRFLKYRRDARVRGYTLKRVLQSLDARAADAQKYILPQRDNADIIFSLIPLNPDLIDFEHDQLPPLKLKVTIRNHSFHEDLARVLIGLSNLHVNMRMVDAQGTAEFEIEGEADFATEDAPLAARTLCPDIFQLLDQKPIWCGGMLGIMQLVALAAIDEASRRRRQ